MTWGSGLTQKVAKKHGRPCLHIDIKNIPVFAAAPDVHAWVAENGIQILNVAGSSESKAPGIQEQTRYIIEGLIMLTMVNAKPGELITDYSNEDYSKRLPIQPKTVDAAVDLVLKDLDLKSKVIIARMSKDELAALQPRLMVYFQNAFGLWEGNSELIESCWEVSGGPVKNVKDAAGVFLGVLWKRLRESHSMRAV